MTRKNKNSTEVTERKKRKRSSFDSFFGISTWEDIPSDDSLNEFIEKDDTVKRLKMAFDNDSDDDDCDGEKTLFTSTPIKVNNVKTKHTTSKIEDIVSRIKNIKAEDTSASHNISTMTSNNLNLCSCSKKTMRKKQSLDQIVMKLHEKNNIPAEEKKREFMETVFKLMQDLDAKLMKLITGDQKEDYCNTQRRSSGRVRKSVNKTLIQTIVTVPDSEFLKHFKEFVVPIETVDLTGINLKLSTSPKSKRKTQPSEDTRSANSLLKKSTEMEPIERSASLKVDLEALSCSRNFSTRNKQIIGNDDLNLKTDVMELQHDEIKKNTMSAEKNINQMHQSILNTRQKKEAAERGACLKIVLENKSFYINQYVNNKQITGNCSLKNGDLNIKTDVLQLQPNGIQTRSAKKALTYTNVAHDANFTKTSIESAGCADLSEVDLKQSRPRNKRKNKPNKRKDLLKTPPKVEAAKQGQCVKVNFEVLPSSTNSHKKNQQITGNFSLRNGDLNIKDVLQLQSNGIQTRSAKKTLTHTTVARDTNFTKTCIESAGCGDLSAVDLKQSRHKHRQKNKPNKTNIECSPKNLLNTPPKIEATKQGECIKVNFEAVSSATNPHEKNKQITGNCSLKNGDLNIKTDILQLQPNGIQTRNAKKTLTYTAVGYDANFTKACIESVELINSNATDLNQSGSSRQKEKNKPNKENLDYSLYDLLNTPPKIEVAKQRECLKVNFEAVPSFTNPHEKNKQITGNCSLKNGDLNIKTDILQLQPNGIQTRSAKKTLTHTTVAHDANFTKDLNQSGSSQQKRKNNPNKRNVTYSLNDPANTPPKVKAAKHGECLKIESEALSYLNNKQMIENCSLKNYDLSRKTKASQFQQKDEVNIKIKNVQETSIHPIVAQDARCIKQFKKFVVPTETIDSTGINLPRSRSSKNKRFRKNTKQSSKRKAAEQDECSKVDLEALSSCSINRRTRNDEITGIVDLSLETELQPNETNTKRVKTTPKRTTVSRIANTTEINIKRNKYFKNKRKNKSYKNRKQTANRFLNMHSKRKAAEQGECSKVDLEASSSCSTSRRTRNNEITGNVDLSLKTQLQPKETNTRSVKTTPKHTTVSRVANTAGLTGINIKRNRYFKKKRKNESRKNRKQSANSFLNMPPKIEVVENGECSKDPSSSSCNKPTCEKYSLKNVDFGLKTGVFKLSPKKVKIMQPLANKDVIYTVRKGKASITINNVEHVVEKGADILVRAGERSLLRNLYTTKPLEIHYLEFV